MSAAASPFEPRIVVFLCSWCSYAAADQAGLAQLPTPARVDAVRVMCSGRVEPRFVLEAFARGADGVLILACHPGDCHYREGNLRAAHRHRLLLRLLGQLGIAPERCRFDAVSAAEGERFAAVVGDMAGALRRLGPLAPPSAIRADARIQEEQV